MIMKKYNKPETLIIEVKIEQNLLSSSPSGVETGGSTGNEYSGSDVTYSRDYDDWDD